MKIKLSKKMLGELLSMACMMLMSFFVISCSDKDSTETNATPFDASQPILVTGFTPESGGYEDQIIVKGKNFGCDKDALTLTIGGKKAVIVNVTSEMIYAFVPSGAYSGEIEISIVDSTGKTHTVIAEKKFNYERKIVVGTLCGRRDENDNQGETWGSFDECTGFRAEGCLAFDPLYPEKLYVAYDRGDGFIAELNLKTRMCTRLIPATKFQNHRLRNIAFSLDGKYMLVSTDRDDNGTHSTSVWIVSRGTGGAFSDRSSIQPLVAYRQCNGVAVHPVNGEVYFNSYENGQLFRMELDDYFKAINPPASDTGEEPKPWSGYLEDGAFRELFKIQDPSYEFQTTIHPSGKYAYLTVLNRSYILRTDYDEAKKEFTTPYVVAGLNGVGGWEDAVGTNSRINRPYQGVFVKNPKYVEEGKEDVYDYYFADCLNFCIRYITPDGLVRTYAGHSPSTDGNIWGTEDGDLRKAARFRDVTGLAYDEKTETFYVLDHNNRSIRTIGKEGENGSDISIEP